MDGRWTCGILALAALTLVGCFDFNALRGDGTNVEGAPPADLAHIPVPWDLSVTEGGRSEIPDLTSSASFGDLQPDLARSPVMLSFAQPVTYAVGPGPEVVAAGDLNGDGKLDLVVANSGGSGVSVLLGMGNGSFAGAAGYPTGSTPWGLVLADLNNDGNLDIATADYGAGAVTVQLGIGNGAFMKPRSIGIGGGNAPFNLVAGDFNGDKKLDLAMPTSGDTVLVLFGDGSGGLQNPRSYPLNGTIALGIGAADFNGDKKLDLVTANKMSSTASLLLGNGDGTFGAAARLGGGALNAPEALAIADSNGDGLLDLHLPNSGGDTVTVLAGKPNGAFAPPVNYPIAANSDSISIATGDFDLDGKIDLVEGGRNVDALGILLGNGNGTFRNPVSIHVSSQPAAEAVGDFNNDGKPDIAVACQGSDTLAVLLNTSR